MAAVTPGDAVSGVDLLPGTLIGTGLVAAAAEENGYALPHPDQPAIYAGNRVLAGFGEDDMDI